jgi:hypothetical protein
MTIYYCSRFPARENKKKDIYRYVEKNDEREEVKSIPKKKRR